MDARIAIIERDSDGWWIILKPGFVVRHEGTHAIVEDTKAKRQRRPVRQYSRDFTPGSRERRRAITIDKVPAQLHAAVVAKAKREGVSVRSLVLTYLQSWAVPTPGAAETGAESDGQ